MKKERNKERDKGGVCYHLQHINKMDRQEWLFIWKKERKKEIKIERNRERKDNMCFLPPDRL